MNQHSRPAPGSLWGANEPPREHFLPLRKAELLEHLCRQLGPDSPQAQELRQIAHLLEALLHYEYHACLEDLKNAYAPFDPDNETHPLVPLSQEQKREHLDALLERFIALLQRANFQHLSREMLLRAIQEGTQWGLRFDVDFSMYDRLEIFVRGASVIRRKRRKGIWPWSQEVAFDAPVYRRMVVILRLKPHRKLPPFSDTQNVYIKVFKDFPRMDMEMVLPGCRPRMTRLDQGKVAVPVATGLTMTGYKLFSLGAAGMKLFATLSSISNLFLLATIAAGSLGYGWRTFANYMNTQRRYRLMLTEHLYFHSLANNTAAICRLLDEAEEQEFREALLAYYLLWQEAPPEGWPVEVLDAQVEAFLQRTAGIQADFEVDDALEKALRLGIVARGEGDRLRAHPPARALENLRALWTSYSTTTARYQPTVHESRKRSPPTP
jgi:hypothetical protein